MALTKSQTATKLAEATGLTKKDVNGFFEELSALAYKEAKNSFTIPCPATFHWVDKTS